MVNLASRVREDIIGSHKTIQTPFGERPLVYADYTASGRSLQMIENYIQRNVLPWYANTHTETSITGAQTTQLREEARAEIKRAVNGGTDDKVIFCGSGTTTCINKLVDLLNLRKSKNSGALTTVDPNDKPVVFIGPYEHHSNELPWRESIAEVVRIPENEAGQIDLMVLEAKLRSYQDRKVKIGSFSAASNVTGIKSDIAAITKLLRANKALSFWDYAAAAPYVAIDMNSDDPIDAVFLSPHKFVGGPGSPGVLVVKQDLLNNTIPTMVGGGTVSYVTPNNHTYVNDPEAREEGGTPAIIESIRAGLAFKLKEEVGIEFIHAQEQSFITRALTRLSCLDDLVILGNKDAPRLSILSARFTHQGKDLHYGFITALFNDLFGIQVRGGCSCAGPYGHALLKLNPATTDGLEREGTAGNTIMRPGWVRMNFNYFIAEDEFEYILRAVELIAEFGWRLLPQYSFDEASGSWRYHGQPMELSESLHSWQFEELASAGPLSVKSPALSFESLIESAQNILHHAPDDCAEPLTLTEPAMLLRWFLLPQEAAEELTTLNSHENVVVN